MKRVELRESWATTEATFHVYPLGRNTYAQEVAAGPDGHVWFAVPDYLVGFIGRMSVAGSLVRIPWIVTEPYWITAGADGHMWVTMARGGYVAQVRTTDFHVTGFSPPRPGTNPGELAGSPNGCVWVLLRTAYGLACVLPGTGFSREVALPRPSRSQFLRDLAVARNGEVWYVEDRALGRLDNHGEVGMHALPADVYAGHIALDAADRVWFTNYVNGAIVRVDEASTNLALTEFRQKDPRATIGDLVAGPDGNIWFAPGHLRAIGRLTPAGAITYFRLPDDTDLVYRLAVGPDGNIWYSFTRVSMGYIGVLVLSTTPVTLQRFTAE